MIGWRRRKEGFDWHKHVRTTVRIRQDYRRRRKDLAKQLAADALKGAGRAGAAAGKSGVDLAVRGAGSLTTAVRSGVAWIIAVIPPTWEYLRDMTGLGLRIAWDAAQHLARVAGRAAVSGSRAALTALRSAAGGAMSLLAAGSVALAARLRGADLRWPQMRLPRGGNVPRLSPATRLAIGRALGIATIVVLAASVVVGGGWLVWTGVTRLASAASSVQLFSEEIQGRAEAVAGDVLRIAGTEIRLAGIEAPDLHQRCAVPGRSRWRCGLAARDALARDVRGQVVTCQTSGADETGRVSGTCRVKEQDLAANLVRAGLAFAETGLFARYVSHEEEARSEKIGIWRGKPERPTEYRARMAEERARAWESAKRRAPGGCPIKGRIYKGRKYYVLPGTSEYGRIRIQSRRGERWFCSEEEAVAAGWVRSPGS